MNDATATHPTPDELLAYPMGELSAHRAQRLFNHCNGCEECGRELAMIMQLRAQVVAAESLADDESSVRRDGLVEQFGASSRSWQWAAVAAGVMLVLAAALLARAVLDVGAHSPPASPYADLATRDTIPQNWYEFRFGPGLLTGSAPSMLRDGLHAVVEERYDEAIAVLQRRVEDTPTDREATAYLGIARYLAGDFSERTAELLQVGSTDPRAGRFASWYLGNLALFTGDLVAARRYFDDLAAVDDHVGREARAMLFRLPE